jgi:hypothetical protein
MKVLGWESVASGMLEVTEPLGAAGGNEAMGAIVQSRLPRVVTPRSRFGHDSVSEPVQR